ncbi:hypothetical protein [Kistimonas asteriae]|uniref:hypothetical protein n=1 Tax=Kistimonas asteriae TaxID=517724 RepID=UPI001BAD600B|nr:hypothetical protein [Kistimonas asteriae]
MNNKMVICSLLYLIASAPCVAEIRLGSGESAIDINIDDLSSGQKLDYTDSTVSLCSSTKATVSMAFTDNPQTSGDFTVLPIGGSANGQDYTLKLQPKGGAEVDPVVKQAAYSISFNSGCHAAVHDTKLHLNFKNLGVLAAGHYESLLRVTVAGQAETIDIPVRIRNGDRVQIKNLEDLMLSDAGTEWVASNSNVCVYSSTGSYALEARSSNRGRLSPAPPDKGYYKIFWKAGSGSRQEMTDQLTSDSGELQGLAASVKLDCTASDKAEVSISMTNSEVNSLSPGVYQDTVTLTVKAI